MIIGIAGGSGAGKTTVARTIAEKFGKENVVHLSLDWYYKDRSNIDIGEREKLNLDHPNSFETDLLISHLIDLKQGKSIDVPIYDYSVHSRTKETFVITPKSVVVLEGILILATKELRNFLDFKVYVDADADVSLIRRLRRDIDERGSTFEQTINRYLATVKPMHEAFVEPSKSYADIIVPRGGENENATDLLADLVEHYTIHKSN